MCAVELQLNIIFNDCPALQLKSVPYWNGALSFQ